MEYTLYWILVVTQITQNKFRKKIMLYYSKFDVQKVNIAVGLMHRSTGIPVPVPEQHFFSGSGSGEHF